MEFPQQVVRQGFLWCLAAIYLFAFSSLYVQIPGLYGANGLLPASYVLHDLSTCRDSHSSCAKWSLAGECQKNTKWMMSHCMKACNDCQALDTSLSGLFRRHPSLLWLTPSLGLDTPTGMEFLCVTGITLSLVLLVSQRCRNCISFLVLWFLYYSLVKVGQIFLWYQWDGLLLETGFLAVIIAPWNISLARWRWICYLCKYYRDIARHHDAVTLWLIKWLLFRLMFASGVVKLLFQDPTWWDLTAMYWHYESQCIPTPIAWYFQKLPKWFHRLSVIITYVIEIGLPFLFFVPVRAIRIFSYFCQVLLQLLILLNGNYNFFNLLTMVLCISLLDDKFITTPVRCPWSSCGKYCVKAGKVGGTSENEQDEKSRSSKLTSLPKDGCLYQQMLDVLITWTTNITLRNTLTSTRDFLSSKHADWIKTIAIVASVISTAVAMCVLLGKWFGFSIIKGELFCWIAFSQSEFRHAVTIATTWAMWIGFLSLLSEILIALVRCLLEVTNELKRAWSVVQCMVFSIVTLWMFAVSLAPLTDVSASAKYTLPSVLRGWYRHTSFLEIAHAYGLFRSMTGIGGRPEIIVLGSNTTRGPWQEFNFLYKPGNVYTPTPFVAPHQPRLDWQMWFAALESYESKPWFLSLLHKLLRGEKDVLHLMGENHVLAHPTPRYIRAQLYKYHYTQNTSSLGHISLHPSVNATPWWSREYVKEYVPFIIGNESLSDLEAILQRYRIYRPNVKPEPAGGFVYKLMLSLRKSHRKTTPTNVISSLLFIAVTLLVFKVWWRKMGKKFCDPTIVRVKSKCEQVNKTLSHHKESMVEICRSYSTRTPGCLRCQCFVVFVQRLSEMYRGAWLMVQGFWNRGLETGGRGWLKLKVKVIKPRVKKTA